MDPVADMVGKDCEKPKFYYAEESQQTSTSARRVVTEMTFLGDTGTALVAVRIMGFTNSNWKSRATRKNYATHLYETCAKDIVTAFDSFARQISKQLAKRVPMTSSRRSVWERRLSHNLKPCADDLAAVFDIHIFKGVKPADMTSQL